MTNEEAYGLIESCLDYDKDMSEKMGGLNG